MALKSKKLHIRHIQQGKMGLHRAIPQVSDTLPKSLAVRFADLILFEFIFALEAIKRCTSCISDISREKKAVGIFSSIAMWAAMVMARAVFPTEDGLLLL